MKHIIYAAMLLLGLSIISSCGKDNPEQKQKQSEDDSARLTRIITEFPQGGHNVCDITYDSKGRVSKVTGGLFFGYDGYGLFSYDDNAKTVKVESTTWDCTGTWHLDDEGRVCENDYFGDTYSYFGGHLSSRGDGETFHWENDCLTSLKFPSEKDAHVYATYTNYDNPFYKVSFDPFLEETRDGIDYPFALGFCGGGSKKLPKTWGEDLYYYNYSFSESGRLKEMQESYESGKIIYTQYYSYSDEIPREPRDEKNEDIPTYLLGDWVITGKYERGEEIPWFLRIGWANEPNKTFSSIYTISKDKLSEMEYEIDEENYAFSNGQLEGFISLAYDASIDIVYKSGHIYKIWSDGSYSPGTEIIKVNDDKYYAPIFDLWGSFVSELYVYERVLQRPLDAQNQ